MFNFMFVFIVVLPSALTSNTFFSQGSTLYRDDARQTVRQHAFLKHDFHYLNVSPIRISSVYDFFDCAFECLSNLFCFSVNVAASKGADGKLRCELLSSDKYRDKALYAENENAHHFSMKPSCVSTYKYDTFDCRCKEGFFGHYCEKVAESCKDVYDQYKSSSSYLVPLMVGSEPIHVLCQMGNFGCGNGGWTPVMKINGELGTFHYDAEYWTDKRSYNLAGGRTGFDSQETKLPTFWNTSFSKICLGMRIGQNKKFIVMNKQAESLYSLIVDGIYRNTSLGRDTWKKLIGPDASLQSNCNMEGFNAVSLDSGHARARIGIIGNNEEDCKRADSWLGFGAGVITGESLTCGNYATANPDNGDRAIDAFGYIFVQ